MSAPTKEIAAAVKKALCSTFPREHVSVRKGTGTASHWIHAYVEIPIPADCSCENPGVDWGEKKCKPCRAAYNNADTTLEQTAKRAAQAAGGFSSYYSDDYSDSRPYDCFLGQVSFIRSTAVSV